MSTWSKISSKLPTVFSSPAFQVSIASSVYTCQNFAIRFNTYMYLRWLTCTSMCQCSMPLLQYRICLPETENKNISFKSPNGFHWGIKMSNSRYIGLLKCLKPGFGFLNTTLSLYLSLNHLCCIALRLLIREQYGSTYFPNVLCTSLLIRRLSCSGM